MGGRLLGAGVLRDGLGALRDCVLGELTREQESNRGLDLARSDGRPLVVVGQPGSLGRDPLEEVVDETVHDAHGLGADAGVRVDLLEDLEDVDGVGFLPTFFPALGGAAAPEAALGGILVK